MARPANNCSGPTFQEFLSKGEKKERKGTKRVAGSRLVGQEMEGQEQYRKVTLSKKVKCADGDTTNHPPLNSKREK